MRYLLALVVLCSCQGGDPTWELSRDPGDCAHPQALTLSLDGDNCDIELQDARSITIPCIYTDSRPVTIDFGPVALAVQPGSYLTGGHFYPNQLHYGSLDWTDSSGNACSQLYMMVRRD